MLVSFVGSPCSGKTTVAALLFAALKDSGVAAEFLPEQARLYIAEKRVATSLAPHDIVALSQIDQVTILLRQLQVEQTMLTACGPNVIIVTDSSPLNSLLYMSKETRDETAVKEAVQKHLRMAGLTFWVKTVTPPLELDPNRVHSLETSLQLDPLVPLIMSDNVGANFKMIPLEGTSHERTAIALAYVRTPRIM